MGPSCVYNFGIPKVVNEAAPMPISNMNVI